MARAGRWAARAGAWVAALLLGGFAAAAQSAPDDQALVPRGEYLARAADCLPCHTADKSKPFAGGLPFHTPFGVLYSVNITSDPQTGIGKWTFADFKNALHNGIRADGAYLYPAMPFDAYTLIEDADLKALWAYIRRLPPITMQNQPNGLSFPFDIRSGMLAWRELFFSPRYFEPTANKSPQWNRGAYLAEALGHCSDCHSPRNIMGAVKGKAQYTGTEIDGFYAPDIAAAALAKTWNKGDLAQFLKTGSAPQRMTVFGPMADVVHDSLAYLTAQDLDDLATWLLDSPPPPDAPAPQRFSALPPAVYQRAARLYIDNCATCHQDHGAGIPGAVPPLRDNPAVIAAQPYNVLMVALGGLPPSGAYSAMPSFAGRLSDQQVADLVNYVRSSWGNRGTPNATPEMVAAWRGIARVPEYGTQSASGFDCPRVGGTPGAPGPNPQAVADLAAMIQGGDRRVDDLAALYRKEAPGAGPTEIADALVAAYCPTIATGAQPTYEKFAELRRFAMEADADARAEQTGVAAFPELDVIWAVPAGRSLVYRGPRPFAGKLVCPKDDGRLVPQELVAKAAALIGKPALPAQGDTAGDLAASLAAQNAKAGPANLANALILAYCQTVAADSGADQALKRAWLQDFGAQAVQALQRRTLAASGG